MPFSAHEAIIKNRPAQVIELVSKSIINLNELNDQGLSLLQLAAKFGMVELTIWLLYADAKIEIDQEFKHEDKLISQESHKSPLYLAMENGHPLVAQILLACGAEQYTAGRLARELNDKVLENKLKQLELNPSVTEALYYWAIDNYSEQHNTKLIKRLAPDFTTRKDFLIEVNEIIEYQYSERKDAYIVINDSPRENILTEAKQEFTNQNPWLAFAVQQEKSLLARELKELGHQDQNTSDLRTPGYWAAMQGDDSTFKAICNTDDDIVKTLWQLQTDDISKFESIYYNNNLVPSSVQEKFNNSNELKQEFILLSNISKIAYKEAARGNTIKLINIFLNRLSFDEKHETIKFSYIKKDYVALKTLLNLGKNDLYKFITIELKQKEINNDFIIFLFIVTGQDMLKLSLSLFQDNKEFFDKFIGIVGSFTGLSKQLINLIINNLELAAQSNEFKALNYLNLNNLTLTNLILDALCDQYKNPSFNLLLKLPHLPITERIKNLETPLSAAFTRLLCDKFSRFHIPIKKVEKKINSKVNELQDMAKVHWQYTYEMYLEVREQARLKQASDYFNNLFDGAPGKKSRELLRLERQINLLSNYIELINKEKANKNWFSHRKINKDDVVLFLAILGFFVWLYYNVNYLIPSERKNAFNLRSQYYNGTQADSRPCIDQYPDTEISIHGLVSHCEIKSGYYIGTSCEDLCHNIRDSLTDSLTSTIFVSIGGFFIVWAGLVRFCGYTFKGQDRFDDISIFDFFEKSESKQKINSAIRALTAEFRTPSVVKDFNGIDQFAGMTTLSKLGLFTTKSARLKTELKAKLDTLKSEIKANEDPGVDEVKEEKTKEGSQKFIPKSKSFLSRISGNKSSVLNEKSPLLQKSDSSLELSHSFTANSNSNK